MVVEGLLARDEPLAVLRAEEEPAAFVVVEKLEGEPGQAVRFLEPARLAGGDVELVEAVGDVGVVLEKAGVLGPALPEGSVEAAFLVREGPEEELAEGVRMALRTTSLAGAL